MTTVFCLLSAVPAGESAPPGFDASVLILPGVLLIAVLAGLILFRQWKQHLLCRDLYRRKYEPRMGNVFETDPVSRTLYHCAADAFCLGRRRLCLMLFKALASRCAAEQERFAAAFFSGQCYLALEQYDRALEQLLRALTIRRDSDAAAYAGSCCEKLNRAEDALRYYRAAVSMDPDHPDANIRLARSCTESGDYAQGMVHASHALSAQPEHPQVLGDMAICCHMLGRQEEFEQHLHRAVAAGEDKASILARIPSEEA